MDDKIIKEIIFEIGQIDRLFQSYAELLEKVKKNEPDLIEITALASVLHSFYTGLENIFLYVAKGIDKDVPTDSAWHRKLLLRMTEATKNRGALLSIIVSEQLTEYMGFRHFYRHAYSFFIDWDKLESLVTPMSEVWKQTKEELQMFLKKLSESDWKERKKL